MNAQKNPYAVALGRLNRGVKKTITETRKAQLRGFLTLANAKRDRIRAERLAAVKPLPPELSD